MTATRGRGPAITDVARLAGVSHQTVSRVINNKLEVSPSTRERVRQAIAQLGYRPNPAARSLAGGRSRTLGVISLNGTAYSVASTVTGVQHAALDRGYALAACNVHSLDPADVEQAVRQLTDRDVEGLVMVTPLVALGGLLRGLPGDLPVVVVEGTESCACDAVGTGQYAASRAATRHLLDCGHATVAHVAGPGTWWEARDRARGWRDALREDGQTPPRPLRGDWSARSGYVAGRSIATDPAVTAVFVANDTMALGLMRAAQELGRRVPEDLSVVGFDDIPEAAYFTPPLTTVRQDFGELGRCSIALLLDHVEEARHGTSARRLTVPSHLVLRSSTGRPGPAVIS